MKTHRSVILLVALTVVWIGIVASPITDHTRPANSVTMSEHLIDLDLHWYNTKDKPVDQISLRLNLTGEIIVLDVVGDPYVLPEQSGLFTTPVNSRVMDDAIAGGWEVVKVQTK